MPIRTVVTRTRQAEPKTTNEFTFSREMIPQYVGGKAEYLQEYRSNAWDIYQSLPMPTLKDEPWRRTDLRGLDMSSFRLPSNAGNLENLPGAPESRPRTGGGARERRPHRGSLRTGLLAGRGFDLHRKRFGHHAPGGRGGRAGGRPVRPHGPRHLGAARPARSRRRDRPNRRADREPDARGGAGSYCMVGSGVTKSLVAAISLAVLLLAGCGRYADFTLPPPEGAETTSSSPRRWVGMKKWMRSPPIQ